MKKWFKQHFRFYMIRPTLYKTFSRFIYALTASLLWDKFVHKGTLRLMYAFLFFGVLFAALTWFSYLRLDGVRLVRIPDWMTCSHPHRSPRRGFGDLSDYVEEDVVNFDDLTEKEQTFCVLLANAACCAAYAVLSLFC